MKRNAARITLCAIFGIFYLVATVPIARSYPPFLKKAKELGLPANDCSYCHVNAKGGQPLGERAKWLVEEKGKRSATAVDVAWLKEYAADAQGAPAQPAADAQSPSAEAAPAQPAAEATTKNLSGVWKMNSAKSKFGGDDSPQSLTVKFDHQGQNLNEVITMVGGEGERTYDLKHTLDGKETVNQVGNSAMKSTAKWEGDVLVIDLLGERPFRRKITFSDGGKVMTMAVNRTESSGEKNDLIVLEKQ